jgi:DNA-directed RNA polymerase I, II, and III subunit RPABC2
MGDSEYDNSEENASINESDEEHILEDNDDDDNFDILEENEEEQNLADIKFNNRSKFDNFNKVMELTNANYDKEDKKKITTPTLTKYERTKIIGIRAEQISSGMPALVKVPANVNNVIEIAEMELEQRKIPFIIKRNLPNKGCEYWKVEDLQF